MTPDARDALRVKIQESKYLFVGARGGKQNDPKYFQATVLVVEVGVVYFWGADVKKGGKQLTLIVDAHHPSSSLSSTTF